MEKRGDHSERNAERDLTAAFCDFVIEAEADELDAAIRDAGMDPEALAREGRTVAEQALARFGAGAEASSGQILREGLGVLLGLLRRREGLTQDALATAARVEVDEIRRIESDASFIPSPRTIYQLEKAFDLPSRALVKLSGLSKRTRPTFTAGVLKFAANAKAMGTLTPDEKHLLNDFVKFLISEESGAPE